MSIAALQSRWGRVGLDSPCESSSYSARRCMASLAASDAAMISASQVLNATETCFLEPHYTAARPSWNTNPD